MKTTTTIFLLILAALLMAGCEDNNNINNPVIADVTPQPPQGVFSITRDNGVELWWAGPYESDIEEYWIYRATSPDDVAPTSYAYQFAVAADPNPDLSLIYYHVEDNNVSNGVTYWYAIASVDYAGHISDLSAEDVWDTPRPEGVTTMYAIYDYNDTMQVHLAGFDFSAHTRVSAASSACDAYIDYTDGIFRLSVGDIYFTRGTEMQDMGYTGSWDDIGWAPTDGWLQSYYTEIVLNHTYVIRTEDYHYVKFRAILVNEAQGYVQFQWAYQEQVDNPELVAPNGAASTTTNIAKPVPTGSVSSL